MQVLFSCKFNSKVENFQFTTHILIFDKREGAKAEQKCSESREFPPKVKSPAECSKSYELGM